MATPAFAPDSPRRQPAKQFGRELRRTLEDRQVSQSQAARDTGISRETMTDWLNGSRLPRFKAASRLAEYLDNDRLAEIVRKARTIACEVCGHTALTEGSPDRKYCDDCRGLVAKTGSAVSERLPSAKPRPNEAVKRLLAGDPEMLARDQIAVRERLGTYQAATAAFCSDCEPEGLCRTPDCPLRPVSPLPLAETRLRRLSA